MGMAYRYFSRNGQVLPANEAVVPLSDIAYAYGFGVYENVRVSHGAAQFMQQHCRRLMESARIIDLQHSFSPELIARSAGELIAKNKVDTCNIKILLIGGTTPETATLNMLCLNPRFPDRALYKHGAHVITKPLERPFPHAKTLNMLPSYLVYREARAGGAYDALLINRESCVTEGTGSNFFALKGRTIYSPPASDILLGVTRDNVLAVAQQNGFTVQEKTLELEKLAQYDSLFLTSTSAKIMPIASVDDRHWHISPDLHELMQAFDDFMRAEKAA